jgi:hypothetical protein
MNLIEVIFLLLSGNLYDYRKIILVMKYMPHFSSQFSFETLFIQKIRRETGEKCMQVST